MYNRCFAYLSLKKKPIESHQCQDDRVPYSFFVDEHEIIRSVRTDILEKLQKTCEETLVINYQPQALFRVRSVARCSSTLSGHTESVLSASFSPDGSQAATGSGTVTQHRR